LLLADQNQAKAAKAEGKQFPKKQWRSKQKYNYVVARRFAFTVNINGTVKQCAVPAGFLCDGATRGLDHFGGWEGVSGLLKHDWLYCTHKADDGTPVPRDVCDGQLCDDENGRMAQNLL
jgi:hypothetical protein